jgi:hypothetical protein
VGNKGSSPNVLQIHAEFAANWRAVRQKCLQLGLLRAKFRARVRVRVRVRVGVRVGVLVGSRVNPKLNHSQNSYPNPNLNPNFFGEMSTSSRFGKL